MCSRAKWLALLAISTLSNMVGSKLVIEGPDPFYNVFQDSNGEIKSQMANFGHIPYGQTLVSLSTIIWLIGKLMICAFLFSDW